MTSHHTGRGQGCGQYAGNTGERGPRCSNALPTWMACMRLSQTPLTTRGRAPPTAVAAGHRGTGGTGRRAVGGCEDGGGRGQGPAGTRTLWGQRRPAHGQPVCLLLGSREAGTQAPATQPFPTTRALPGEDPHPDTLRVCRGMRKLLHRAESPAERRPCSLHTAPSQLSGLTLNTPSLTTVFHASEGNIDEEKSM